MMFKKNDTDGLAEEIALALYDSLNAESEIYLPIYHTDQKNVRIYFPERNKKGQQMRAFTNESECYKYCHDKSKGETKLKVYKTTLDSLYISLYNLYKKDPDTILECVLTSTCSSGEYYNINMLWTSVLN